MGCGARVMRLGVAGVALFVLFACVAQPAHGIRTNGMVENYEAEQQLRNAHGPIEDLFERWVEKHSRAYHSQSEKEYRFRIFKDNLLYMHNHNKQQKSYWMGLNKFSDLTHSEFYARYLGGYRASGFHNLHTEANFVYNNVVAEPNVDWRQRGAISEVKNQGNCGSCWAFSATGAVEAANQIATGKMVLLSEQELLDCNSPPNLGCDGGSMRSAFQYMYTNGGIRTESEYPYMTASGGPCIAKKQNSTIVSIGGFELVPEQSESSLLKAVSMTPVSVGIEAGGRDFQHYQGGVFTGSCGTELDHGVLVVGYGTDENGANFWIVKNSWGQYWGEAGYIRMERLGSNNPFGKCGINLDPSFPIKHGPNSA